MAEEPRPVRSARLDRIGDPDPGLRRVRDAAGKEALYSTAPSAAPSSQVQVHCRRCDVDTGVSVVVLTKLLLRRPVLWNPVAGTVWTRCPTCERRSWLRIRQGQALRALLDRRPIR